LAAPSEFSKHELSTVELRTPQHNPDLHSAGPTDEGHNMATVEGRIDASGMGPYTIKVISVAGVLGYGLIPAFWICQPVFINPKLAESFGVEKSAMALPGSLTFLGWAIGAFTLTKLADIYGRKLIMYLSLAICCGISVLSLVSTNLIVYSIARFILGGGLGGFGAISYIYSVEFLPSTQRGPMSCFFNCFFSTGIVILTIVAMGLQNTSWRIEIIVNCLPGILLLLTYPIMPESPRWLMVVGRLEEAEQVLKLIEAGNGTTVIEEPLCPAAVKTQQEGEGDPDDEPQESVWESIVKMMRPSLRVKAWALFFCWFAVTLTYYGLAYSAGDMAGGMYLNSILLAIVELPAQLFCYFALDNARVGRKGTQMISFGVAGVALVLIIFFRGSVLETPLAMIGKLGATAAFVTVYIFAGELFPTSVRATGLGCCNIFARIGGILAPYAEDLPISARLLSFGLLAAFGVVATVALPETLGAPMKDIMDEDCADGGAANDSFKPSAYAGVQTVSQVETEDNRLVDSPKGVDL